jgi:hypothetical protein
VYNIDIFSLRITQRRNVPPSTTLSASFPHGFLSHSTAHAHARPSAISQTLSTCLLNLTENPIKCFYHWNSASHDLLIAIEAQPLALASHAVDLARLGVHEFVYTRTSFLSSMKIFFANCNPVRTTNCARTHAPTCNICDMFGVKLRF